MASLFITKNALFRSPKSFPLTPLHSLRSSHKPIKLVFATASNSNYSDWRNAAEGVRDSQTSWTYDSTNSRQAADSRDYDRGERAKETMREGVDEAKERAQEMRERTKEYAHDAKEKTKDVAGSMADNATETKDSVKNAAGSVADKAKETVKGAWGKAKDTAQKAKETVVGKDEDDGRPMDEDVIELRKNAEKVYDQRKG